MRPALSDLPSLALKCDQAPFEWQRERRAGWTGQRGEIIGGMTYGLAGKKSKRTKDISARYGGLVVANRDITPEMLEARPDLAAAINPRSNLARQLQRRWELERIRASSKAARGRAELQDDTTARVDAQGGFIPASVASVSSVPVAPVGTGEAFTSAPVPMFETSAPAWPGDARDDYGEDESFESLEGGFFSKIGKAVGKVAKIAGKVAPVFGVPVPDFGGGKKKGGAQLVAAPPAQAPAPAAGMDWKTVLPLVAIGGLAVVMLSRGRK